MNKLLIILIALVAFDAEARTDRDLLTAPLNCAIAMLTEAGVENTLGLKVTNKILPGLQGAAGKKIGENNYKLYIDIEQIKVNGQPFKGGRGVQTVEIAKVVSSIIANHTGNPYYNTAAGNAALLPVCYGATK